LLCLVQSTASLLEDFLTLWGQLVRCLRFDDVPLDDELVDFTLHIIGEGDGLADDICSSLSMTLLHCGWDIFSAMPHCNAPAVSDRPADIPAVRSGYIVTFRFSPTLGREPVTTAAAIFT
jgi:hypothetical protein